MLRNSHFLFLWCINIATTLAIVLLTITLLVSVFEQTDFSLLTTGTMVARTFPPFILAPIAGVLVDRFPHKIYSSVWGRDSGNVTQCCLYVCGYLHFLRDYVVTEWVT